MEAGQEEEPPLQRGDVVCFGEGKTGTITRAYPVEDQYAIRALGAVGEIKGKDNTFFYFRRAELKRAVALPQPNGGTGSVGGTGVGEDAVTAAGAAGLPPSQQPAYGGAGVAGTAAAEVADVSCGAGPPGAVPRLEGRVKWYLKDKGFGKITPIVHKGQPAGEDVFVHKNQIEGGAEGAHARAIAEGARVTYELTSQVDGKPCACRVQVDGVTKALAAISQGPVSGTSKEYLLRHLIHTGLRVGTFQEKGHGKAAMEDRLVVRAGVPVDSLASSCQKVVCAFFGVFDGHSGASCSEFLGTNLDRSVFECLRHQNQRDTSSDMAIRTALLAAFRTTEHNFFQFLNRLEGGAAYQWATAGSTACTVLFWGPDEEGRLRLAVANAGDSRAVLGRRDGGAVRLSEDHTPNLPMERRRIEQEGAAVVQVNGIWRIVLKSKRGEGMAGLSVSRGFGDLDYKQPAAVVSAVPDVIFRTVDLREDCFVVICSDGVCGPITDGEATRIVATALRESVEEPAKLAAHRLVEAAHQRDPGDDKTALVIWFGDAPAAPATVVAAPARVAGLKRPPQVSASAAGVADDMFTAASKPVKAHTPDLTQLDDLFASYARDMAAQGPAVAPGDATGARKKRR